MARVPWVVATALALALLFVGGGAWAHAIGLSRGEYSRAGSKVTASFTFARADALALAPDADADQDGVLAQSEVLRNRKALARGVLERVAVRSGEATCTPSLDDARLVEADGIALVGTFTCPDTATTVTVDLADLLGELPRGHRHLARLRAEARDVVLFRGSSALDLAAESAQAAPPGAPRANAFGLFRMGVEHILTGYDHLLFLLGLVLVAKSFRSLLPVVTAFTVAHSLTLAVAVLGLWTPPSRFVEPAIALSIAYVGVENLFMTDVRKRWRVTFPFGLIHGFGFASALHELALPRAAVPTALLSFNLGVEAGQLGVLAVMVPLVLAARRLPLQGTLRTRLPSLGVAAVGAVWFVARIV
jgi:hydrogenase/urease accessory protein HupE